MMKNDTPKKTATPVIKWMKWAISLAIGVSPTSSPEAKLAILPITVLSPVLTTIPRHVPTIGLNIFISQIDTYKYNNYISSI